MQTKKKAVPNAVNGGLERARKLTSEQRSEIARQGAIVRWTNAGKEPPVLAKYGAVDRPLRIGEIEIPCYVLAEGRILLASFLTRALLV